MVVIITQSLKSSNTSSLIKRESLIKLNRWSATMASLGTRTTAWALTFNVIEIPWKHSLNASHTMLQRQQATWKPQQEPSV